jgi:hypothetical protein
VANGINGLRKFNCFFVINHTKAKKIPKKVKKNEKKWNKGFSNAETMVS